MLTIIVCVFVFSTGRHTVDFNTEVKPIINTKCITCHGGVKKQGGFSLLFRSDALAKTKSGKYAIVPGEPDESEMIRRVQHEDPEERMPYHKSPLSDDEIDLLALWIKQGAAWGTHWAYQPVKQQKIPGNSAKFLDLFSSKNEGWPKTDIDFFILEKLEDRQLTPSPQADKATLLRRSSLDLTGLPPSEVLAHAFLNSKAENAYEILLDSLLTSPRYGERWTSVWMDLSRYADTKGYERDPGRTIWRYRDWLIKAFNADKPYDRFLTEQLAGDLLPGATDDDFIATAFHRNTMTNDEGGTDNEEFRTAAIIDRVNTTWETLLGTTFSCVQCHSHPYDPFRHEEYYKFAAFFNNSRDEDTYADYPLLKHFDEADRVRLTALSEWLHTYGYQEEATEELRFLKTWQPAFNSLLADSFINSELSDTKWLSLRSPSSARLKSVSLDNKSQLMMRFESYFPGGLLSIHLDSSRGKILKRITLPKTSGWMISSFDFPLQSGRHDLYLNYENPAIKDPEKNAARFDWFRFSRPFPGKSKPGFDSVYNMYNILLNRNTATTPVMMDNPDDMYRKTNVFERGNWMVKGVEVKADVPHVLNAFPKPAPRNRMGLAMWMTDKNNPLTARTMVNRLWEQLFGNGLVETLEDMGTMGTEPSHKELLDHLAYSFMHQHNWSLKKMLKEIMMSATYRQQSQISKVSLEKDPQNRYYSRGPRFRLSAEQLRDQALAVSGILSNKMYGASVMPWQPAGIWNSPYNDQQWVKSKDEDQYRRAIYTYWKRTAAYPSMITHDAVGREVCVARRIRTNTPLQALAMLNDSVFLEASRHLAIRIQKDSREIAAYSNLINRAYQLAMLKPISENRRKALEQLYLLSLQEFQHDKEKSIKMMGGDSLHANAQTAALVVVANALLNLDEFVTKN